MRDLQHEIGSRSSVLQPDGYILSGHVIVRDVHVRDVHVISSQTYVIVEDGMDDGNHLHVCRHCGNVMATSSRSGPRECFNCEGEVFSQYLSIPERSAE